MNRFLKFLIFFLLISCSEKENQKHSFVEEFDENSRGWIEEKTDFHTLQIQNGYYEIENKDSISNKSSTRCLDKSWFYKLPDSYEIQASIDMNSEKEDTLSCGLILEGNTYLYEFRFLNTGEVIVSEYNFVNKKTVTFEEFKNIPSTENIKCSIKIKDWKFWLIVNEIKVGEGNLNSKSWDRIVPFTGKLTKSRIDFLRIIEN